VNEATKILTTIAILAVLCSAQAAAFSWPWQRTEQPSVPDEELLNVHDALAAVNADKLATTELKMFSGEAFCVSTEKRVEYAGVAEDGTVYLLKEEPQNCWSIETNEAFALKAYNEYRNGREVAKWETLRNVDIPWRLYRRIFFG